MLKTAIIGKAVNGTVQLSRLMVMSGDRIVLVDATTGQPPKKVTTKMVDKDLHIFAEDASDPSVIVSDYALYDQTVQITGLGSGGEYVNYGLTATDTMELGAVSAIPATASTPIMSNSAWWGVGILAVAGGVAAAAGGGGSGGNSAPAAASTPLTATLVDSLVNGVSYTTSSGLHGVTGDAGSFGSFHYNAGDTVTFKVGAATIGTYKMNADGIVTLQDIVGVDPSNTTDTKLVSIAQFLQSLDTDNNPANGIVINQTEAAKITTAINVQTATVQELTTAIQQADATNTLVSSTDAMTHLDVVANDTTPPTAAITLSDTVLNSGEIATVTITFSEAVVGFNNADVTVQNGTLGTLHTTDSGVTWTATFTPTANLPLSSTNVITLASGSYTDMAGNAGTAATSAPYTVNTMIAPPPPPTVVITDDENAVGNIAGGIITYTFTFTENVTGFTADDITVTNGSKGVFSGSGSTYILVVTPTAGFEGNMTVGVAAGVAMGISGNQNIAAISTQVVDMLAPVAPAFALTDTGVSNSDGITNNPSITISGLETNATWQYSLNAGTTWIDGVGTSFNLANNATYGVDAIQVHQIDAAGNVSRAITNADPVTIDKTAPTVAITNDQVGTANIAGGDIVYTFTFSEAMNGFAVGDVTVGNATKGVFAQISPSVYTLVVTPTATGDVSVDVAASMATDTAGNGNTIAITSHQTVDFTAPTVTSVILADTALTIGQTSAVTITFSEAVKNFSNANIDLTGAQGTLSTLTSSDNIHWTGLFTPTATTTDASNVIRVLSTYTDMAGNAGALATSANFTIDTRANPVAAPTFALTADNGLSTTDGITHTNGVTVSGVAAGNTWEYSLNGGTTWNPGTGSTFNLVANTSYAPGQIEVRQTDTNSNVSIIATNTQTTMVDTIVNIPVINTVATNNVVDAYENANLIISGTGEAGATVTLAVANQTALIDASGAWNITVLDRAASFSQGSETLSVIQTDVAGNTSLAGARDIFIDTVKPTLDSSIGVKANIGSDSVTLTFNESLAPVAFANSGSFIVEINGTVYNAISPIKSSDLISAVATTDKTVTLVLDTGIHNINFGDVIRVGYIGVTGGSTTAIQDLSGNDAPSFGYVTATVENTDTPPVLTNMVANGANITLTFNEALNAANVNLPATSDFTVKVNGVANTVSGVSITGSNVALTLAAPYANNDLVEVTYKDNVSTTNAIQDLIGNDALSFTYTSTADTVSPTATITMSDTALTTGETSTATIIFSETVTGFSLADLTAPNGALSALNTNDNITWTAIFTPTTNVTSAAQTIDLAATYSDVVGNIGTVEHSLNYTIDTQAPQLLLPQSVDAVAHQMTFNFDKALDPVNFAPTTMFTATDGVTLNPNDLTQLVHFTISNVAILNDLTGGHVSVTIDPSIAPNTTNPSPVTWTLVYNDAPGNDVLALQDIYGNDVSSFTRTAVI